MSERHTFTEDDLLKWAESQWVQFACIFGEFSHKSFDVNFYKTSYRVIDHQRVVYEGGDRALAIERYNEAE